MKWLLCCLLTLAHLVAEGQTIVSTDTLLCVGQAGRLHSTQPATFCIWSSLHDKVSLNRDYGSPTDTVIITGKTAGTDTIIMRANLPYWPGYMYDSMPITINPIPNMQLPSNICKGASILLSNSMAGGMWTTSDSNKFIIAAEVAKMADTGAITISYTLPTGCATSGSMIIQACPAAEVFPNPAKDELIVHILGLGFASCMVTNSIGQVIIEAIPVMREYTTINMSKLAPGMYYIRLTGNAETFIARIFKE